MTTTKTNDDVLIQLENVGKVFYTDEMETHALSEVHLTIRRGEYVSIEGPSGSGSAWCLVSRDFVRSWSSALRRSWF